MPDINWFLAVKKIPTKALKGQLSSIIPVKGISMVQIEYITTDENDLEIIRHLWVQLNEHHHERASHFRPHYEQMTFDDRKTFFETIASTGLLRLDLARDPGTARIIGYCVSSISSENNGEIESVFVEPDYRRHDIGSDFISRAIAWMDYKDVKRKRVSIGDGNEETWQFYRKFGLYPRMTILEQIRE
ncbi:MAG: GNAT family N-acetyltransferase [Methanoregula sp.]